LHERRRYWVCMYTRDGALTLESTLKSIASQTKQPKFIIVVDDGSKDETPKILRKFGNIYVIRTSSKTRDIRRAPWLVNLAYERALTLGIPEYRMITGDDCVYPRNYVEELVRLMDSTPRIAVASGDRGRKVLLEIVKPPEGSGRLIRESFMDIVGGAFPLCYGWEDWILHKALQMGFQIRNLTWLRFTHSRAYSSRQTFNWGRAMRALGYDPFSVFVRVGKNIAFGDGNLSVSASLSVLAGYVTSFLSHSDDYMKLYDEDLRKFVRQSQHARLKGISRAKIRRRLIISGFRARH
jgi:glycosyltransferase involved in cell wall biosynthesis